VSTTVEERNEKLRVSLGGETEVITPPHGKDVDVQLLVDLRRMLTKAVARTRQCEPVAGLRQRYPLRLSQRSEAKPQIGGR
jgi:hypothetical protein